MRREIRPIVSLRTATARALLGILCLAVISACSDEPYDGRHWSESAFGAIGGTLLATEGRMYLVNQSYQRPARFFEVLQDLLAPFPVARADDPAANRCAYLDPDVDNTTNPSFSCEADGTLVVFYENCVFEDRESQQHGYWRTYSRLKLPDQATCTDLLKNTITFEDASLTGQTVTRLFGLSEPGTAGDESNWRITARGTLDYIHSYYPSGWYDFGVRGGMEVTFGQDGSTLVRQLTIQGLRVAEYQLDDQAFRQLTGGKTLGEMEQMQSFTLNRGEVDADVATIETQMDSTLDTQEMGTIGAGPTEQDDWEHQGVATHEPIVVTGTGLNRTLASFKVRIQHNQSETIAVAKPIPSEVISRLQGQDIPVDTRAISWAYDEKCCWPTQGEFLTNFYHTDHFAKPFKSMLTRFTSTCGVVEVRYYSERNAVDGMNDLEPRLHNFYHCY